MDDLKNKKIRIKLNKQETLGEISGIDYFFFTFKNIGEFIDSIDIAHTKYKLNFAYYGSEAFSTPLINFVGLTHIPGTIIEKIPIEDSILLQVNRLLKNTERKFSSFNNPFSFYPENTDLNELNELQLILVKKLYHSFFKLISYQITDDGTYDIRGKKTISITEDDGFSTINYKIFYKLITFLFEDEKFLKKYLIIKNVLTRYINDNGTFSKLDIKITEIEKTINYYFEKYVQEDLELFFQNRDVVFKETINMSKSISEQNDKVNSYLTTSLISSLVLAISFIFKNILSLSTLNLLFANLFLIPFSIIFYHFIHKTSLERFETIQNQINLFLEKMGIILPAEKKEINRDFIIKPKEDLFNNIKRIKVLLICSNSLLFVITLISYFYSHLVLIEKIYFFFLIIFYFLYQTIF